MVYRPEDHVKLSPRPARPWTDPASPPALRLRAHTRMAVRSARRRPVQAWSSTLLQDLIAQAFEGYNRQGTSIDPRPLVVLDEAANTPQARLPRWAATIIGAGIQLATLWQSKAQLGRAYGKDADNVQANQGTKLIFPTGLSDLSTIEYISALVGDEHARGD